MRHAPLGLAVVLAASAAQAMAAPLPVYEAEANQVLASYEASIGRSRISGTASALEWSIERLGEGQSLVRLRMLVDSFSSGHPGLDAAMRKAMESNRFPIVELEGITGEGDSSLHGTITMHGVTKALTATLAQTRIADKLVLRVSLAVALDEFGVVAPSVVSEKMGNVVEVSVLGILRVHPDSIISGGARRPD